MKHKNIPVPSLAKIMLIVAMLISRSSQYSIMNMQDYRPPVKSSVKTLHSDRQSSAQSTTRTSRHHTSEKTLLGKQQQKRRFSWKSSHAGGISVPLPDSLLSHGVQSFERRMRELVLGAQRTQSNKELIQQQHQHQQQAQTTELYVMNEITGVPSNVKVINSLEEYRQVVGEERELLVVVRFFASYCKVRTFQTLVPSVIMLPYHLNVIAHLC
jgi:hypothetical protein